MEAAHIAIISIVRHLWLIDKWLQSLFTLMSLYFLLLSRFHKLMVFFGHPLYTIKDAKPHAICKIVSEFALEYRTTREKIREQNEKKRREAERANRISRRSVDSVWKWRILLFLYSLG